MTYGERARTPTSRIRIRRTRVAGLLLAVAVIVAVIGDGLPAPSSPAGAGPSEVPRGAPSRRGTEMPGAAAGQPRGPLGEADGAVPAGTTVFNDGVPGVANLDPALLGALRRAASAAAGEGVEFVVNGGWRSPEYEDQLRREAIARYGSEAEAARWVATGTTSPHVSGDAVDIGPSDATTWLAGRGAAFGLCRIYANEPWHYELRPEAAAQGCPPTYADPTHDPRLERR